ncbi:MAG TPA: sugar phosphate isomerase/epimerase [Bryobacteraceae bacterium]|jgi:sugar phosphate isomerase/epimerase
MSFSRRDLLLGAAAAVPLRSAFAASLSTIGVQLYTVRNIIEKQPAETLKAIDAIGYREAEATSATLDKIWSALKETRLKPVSVHIDNALFKPENKEKLTTTIADVKGKGFSYAVYPYVPPALRHGADTFKELADTLNRVGAECKKAGMKLCYHNHAFEYQTFGSQYGLEIMMDALDKTNVGLELDAFWASVGGHDPVELLNKYKGRVDLMHIKDKAEGTPVQYNETVPKTAFKEAGKGVLDWSKILKAAHATGVKHYFVEQDQTPGNPIDSLRTSYEYLHALKW